MATMATMASSAFSGYDDLRKNNVCFIISGMYGPNAQKAGIKTVSFFETTGVNGVIVVDRGSATHLPRETYHATPSSWDVLGGSWLVMGANGL